MSLSESCAKALSDKTYEKRKMGAVEVEKYFLVKFCLSIKLIKLFPLEWSSSIIKQRIISR